MALGRWIDIEDGSCARLLWLVTSLFGAAAVKLRNFCSAEDSLNYRIIETVDSLLNSKKLIWSFLGFGVLARLAQYLSNRSLWLDEAWLAANILNRSFGGLLGPLDDRQNAPIGFLLVVRSTVEAFGSSEYALRLFPLLCGILSVLLFYRLARRILSTEATAIALGLFAVADRLVYYSSELKQYSTDVTVTLILYLSVIGFLESSGGIASSLRFVAIGAIAVWFSYPSVFVLAGIGIVLLWHFWRESNWKRTWTLVFAGIFWVVSFGVGYLLFLKPRVESQGIVGYFSGYFAPFPPTSLRDLAWYPRRFLMLLADPVGFKLAGIATLALLMGATQLWRKRPLILWFLALPPLITVAASAARLYPLMDRLVLFLIPGLFLVIGAGAEEIWSKTRQAFPLLGTTFLALLLLPPVLFTGLRLVKPRVVEEVRPVLAYVNQSLQKGDTVYVYYSTRAAYRYYEARGVIESPNMIIGRGFRRDPIRYLEEIDRLRGRKRVWFVFSHVWDEYGLDEEKYFLDHLNEIGVQLSKFQREGAAAYLYDLSGRVADSP